MPVIFSHGLWSNSAHYGGHCVELASHGYAVFAIDHNDLSGLYTEKKGGVPVNQNPAMTVKTIKNFGKSSDYRGV